MKRIVISVLVVALLLGLGYISLSTQSSAAPPTAATGIRLVTIAEDLTLAPGETLNSEKLDVKTFRLFKLYARLTPFVSKEIPPMIEIHIHDSLPDTAGGGAYGCTREAEDEWNSWKSYWGMAYEFDGIYSMLGVKVNNQESVPVTISLYLLMAEE